MKNLFFTLKLKMIITIALVIVMSSSCSNDSKLSVMANIANTQCPIQAGTGMTVEKVDYNDTENMVQYHIVISKEAADYNQLKQNADLAKQIIMSSVATSEDDALNEMIAEIVNCEAGLSFIYYNFDKSDKFVCSINSKELIDIEKNGTNCDEILKSIVDSNNKDFPRQLDELTIIKSMKLEENCVSYNYEVTISDEMLSDFDVNLLKQNISESLTAPELTILISNCIATNRSLVYLYSVNNSEEQSFEIEFTPTELSQIIAK